MTVGRRGGSVTGGNEPSVLLTLLLGWRAGRHTSFGPTATPPLLCLVDDTFDTGGTGCVAGYGRQRQRQKAKQRANRFINFVFRRANSPMQLVFPNGQ